MKQKQKYIIYLPIFLGLLLAAGVFLYHSDLGNGLKTSLVKKYYWGSPQCVAYVEKYYKDVFNIEITNVGRAMNIFEKAESYGLYAHENGGKVYPQPGDILVFGHKNRVGHVAIVTGVIKEGVLIVEQNWGTTRITENSGQPIPMKRENGNYMIENRDSYYVMGWLSRMSENPDPYFNFSGRDADGWIPERGLRTIDSEQENVWTVEVRKSDPTILSPIFIDGLNASEYKKVLFQARIKNNPKAEEGVLYFRGADDQWDSQIEFEVEPDNGALQVFSVNLDALPDDYKITQMKLKLADPSNVRKETWEMSWLDIR